MNYNDIRQMTVSENEIKDFSNIKTIDITKYQIDLKNEVKQKLKIAVIGLGATGSAFIMLLSHFLRYQRNVLIDLFDGDYVEHSNMSVSLYGFMDQINIKPDDDYFKADISRLFLIKLVQQKIINSNNIIINSHNDYVDEQYLELLYNDDNPIDAIFVFTDTNESRHEIAQFHLKHPETLIIDTRIGTYDQYEVILSKNADKYHSTIYYENDGSIMHVDEHRLCLDDRMSFSVAMSASALAMNLFMQYGKKQINGDFKHIMIGRDYLGVIKHD